MLRRPWSWEVHFITGGDLRCFSQYILVTFVSLKVLTKSSFACPTVAHYWAADISLRPRHGDIYFLFNNAIQWTRNLASTCDKITPSLIYLLNIFSSSSFMVISSSVVLAQYPAHRCLPLFKPRITSAYFEIYKILSLPIRLGKLQRCFLRIFLSTLIRRYSPFFVTIHQIEAYINSSGMRNATLQSIMIFHVICKPEKFHSMCYNILLLYAILSFQ